MTRKSFMASFANDMEALTKYKRTAESLQVYNNALTAEVDRLRKALESIKFMALAHNSRTEIEVFVDKALRGEE